MGFDNTIDWSKQEPSLPLIDTLEEVPQSSSSHAQHQTFPHSHQYDEIGIPPNITNPQPLTPESIPSPSNCYTHNSSMIPSPQSLPNLKQQEVTVRLNHIQSQSPPHSTPGNTLPPPLKALQPIQPMTLGPPTFNFGIPVNTPIFSNTTEVLLPTHQLSVVLENSHTGKVPVKRLENTKEPVKKKQIGDHLIMQIIENQSSMT